MRATIPKGIINKQSVDLIGVSNTRLRTRGSVVLCAKTEEDEFPLKFMIVEELNTAILSFRVLVLLG